MSTIPQLKKKLETNKKRECNLVQTSGENLAITTKFENVYTLRQSLLLSTFPRVLVCALNIITIELHVTIKINIKIFG